MAAADLKARSSRSTVSFTDNEGNAEGPLASTASDTVVAMAATTVTIAADRPAIINAIDHLDFTLTRTGGDTSAALTVTLTLAQTREFRVQQHAERYPHRDLRRERDHGQLPGCCW